MGIQINGNNDIISALDGSWTAEGASINTSGILTATTFKGNVTGTACTFVDGKFTGNVTIGGTLTYEDVTNIDSVGIITAKNAIVISEDNAIHFRGISTDDNDAILRQSAGGGQLLINSRHIAKLNIDSNGDSTDAYFAIGHGAATGSSSELFRVQEDGKVGIGIAAPVGNLEVRDSKANLIVAKDGLTVKGNSDLHTSYDLIQLGAGGALASYSTATATADTQFIHNAYRHSGGSWKYRYADTAMRFRMNSPGGAFIFDSAASGSANADITFSEKLRITSAGDLKLNQTQSKINLNTSDGSDNKYLSIGGGGDASQTRGAGITLYGNEVSSHEGRLQILAGNSGNANGIIQFHTGGNNRLIINSSGQIKKVQDATNRTALKTYSGEGLWFDHYQVQSSGTYRRYADIAAVGDGSWGSILRFHTMPDSGSPTERLRIDKDGHVIIGGISWGVAGSMSIASYGGFRSVLASGQAQDTLIGAISGVSNGFQTNTDASNNQTYTFHNGSAVALRITSAGKVGIGQGTPTEIFHIKQNDTTGPSITLEHGSSSHKCWINNWGSSGGGSGRQNKFEINATTVSSLALASAYISLQAGGAGDSFERVRINTTGLLPGTDNNLNLGSSSKRWQNIYTGDLQLSNVSGSTDQNGESITPVGNEVDNTQGTWTIQEGLNDLFLINRIDGKKYKFNLTEVS